MAQWLYPPIVLPG